MASSFRLKRKLYSSDTEGSSFGKKALAVGGTLAATAGWKSLGKSRKSRRK